MIEIDTEDMKIVHDILRRFLPGIEVRAYGSRVSGGARKFSDLDLVAVPQEKLDTDTLESVREAFALSNLTIVVEIIDWHTMPESFRERIERQYEVIQQRQ